MKVKNIPTKYLKAIIENEGLNYHHTKDYHCYLEEMTLELYDRMNRESELAQLKFEREQNDKDYLLLTQGKTCTTCNAHASYDDLDSLFYKKLGKYRSECKKCSKDKIKRTRELKKIETPF